MSANVVLASGDARVVIAPATGGAIVAFDWRDQPVLRPTPSAALGEGDVRRMACYPLVPYSNRIRNAGLAFEGRTYSLARNFDNHPHSLHGIGWQRAWNVVDATPTQARLTLEHDAQGEQARSWPWSFTATQFFSITTAPGPFTTLTLALGIVNQSDRTFPFGLGWHPFFPATTDTHLRFAASGVWLTDETVIPREHRELPHEWDFTRARPLAGLNVDNVFTGWDGHAWLHEPRAFFDVDIDADSACRFVVVYAPPGAGFIAIEPVTHMTDAFNRAAAGERATGTRLLPPGAAFSCTMRFTVKARA
ncbi:MAG TPA: aldose 1-epimerase [Casimicrobiaceae bacterium]|nr:aldose 1-epimerase [Casimicrobiaceae bacterium]